MVQRMYRMINEVDSDSSITIATSESQTPQIKYQLGENVGISIEPCRRGTFPAIALACAFLKKNGVEEDESVVVCPVDPYVNEDYFLCLNELNIPLISIGAKNMIIAATPDGILVSDKEESPGLKDYVEKARPMHEARPWGHYTVLDSTAHKDGQNSLTKHLIISPNQHISYQIHRHRTEMWTFIEGDGDLIINGKVSRVTRGDSIVVPAGTKHAIKALDEELHIIEVQVGDNLVEEDIERLDWNWD